MWIPGLKSLTSGLPIASKRVFTFSNITHRMLTDRFLLIFPNPNHGLILLPGFHTTSCKRLLCIKISPEACLQWSLYNYTPKTLCYLLDNELHENSWLTFLNLLFLEPSTVSTQSKLSTNIVERVSPRMNEEEGGIENLSLLRFYN